MTEPITVIVPALNERDHVQPLVQALLDQTRPPDEIVIADGGSTDGTREELARLASEHPELRVVDGPGGIAENRNAAIRAASSGLIACTDAGCLPEPQWLETMASALEDGADWVAGIYLPADPNPAWGLALMPVPAEIDPARFLPGGGSQAFRREAWARVGGFPEGMTAAEDTLFGQRLLRAGYRPVFRPQAVARWSAPGGPLGVAAKSFYWGRSDGRAGTADLAHLRLAAGYWGPLGLAGIAAVFGWWWVAGVFAAAPLLFAWVKTKHRRRHLSRWWQRVVLPLAYLVKTLSQTVGWGLGTLPRLPRLFRRLFGRGVAAPTATAPAPDMRAVRPDPAAATEARGAVVTPGLDEATRVRVLAPLADPLVKVAVLVEAGKVGAAAYRPQHRDLVGNDDPAIVYHLAVQAGLAIGLAEGPAVPPDRTDRIGDPGAVVVLAAVPLHDVGGGSRGAQLAQEFVARGFHVTYSHLFDSGESVSLGLRHVHPDLEAVPVGALERQLAGLEGRLETDHRLCIVEMPHPAYLPAVETLRAAGFRVVYDLIDDWSDPALGWWGYRPKTERRFIAAADLLVASAESLAKGLERRARRPVTLMPNGVDTRLFRPGEWPRPADLPATEGPILEYHGSLYGDWFDWEGVAQVAEAYPDGQVVLIGDPPEDHPLLPDNVSLLGLKPQHELPAYLAHSDVGLVPFLVNETTHAVSPLKVYEYLATGLPVAATPLQPLLGLDGVYADTDLVAAVGTALAGARPDPVAAHTHSWHERTGRILGALGLPETDEGTPVKAVVRN